MSAIAGLIGRILSGLARPAAPGPAGPRRLLVDLSTIAQHDAGTGIQRVVRAIWLQLYAMDLGDVVLVPVAASARRGYAMARFDAASGEIALPDAGAPLIEAGAGDLFLGLDLAAHRLSRHHGQIARWRKNGVSINILIYDLLPLQHPGWFPRRTGRYFGKWIRIVARHADRAICISRQVAGDLDDWLAAAKAPRRGEIAMPVIPLSGAVEASNPTRGIGPKGREAIAHAQRRPTVLMVGTIEPRKGHDCVLDAMVHLWRGADADAPHLIIVGRRGWRTEAMQARMAALDGQGDRFTWLKTASDELLSALYERAALVVVASRGEGFGLPIVEALRHGRKVLARDLPVFRELERPGLFYFSDDSPAALADSIVATLNAPAQAVAPDEGWDISARALLAALDLGA